MPEEKIYLVDATSICYRSFFAIKLSNSKGFPTGAIYGFYQTLKKIITKYKPQYIGICFDVSRKTFRQEKFKEYKIQRPPTPDDLKTQIPIIKKLVNLLGFKLIEKEGFEADDIIATLAKKAVTKNMDVVIVSSDKDMLQLIDSDKIQVFDSTQDELFNEETFKNEFGFTPSYMVDYLSLTGDSADNVPGAKGIGKVGALKLITEFGTVENMFDNLTKISPKTKEILTREKEKIFLSKDLVRLCECDLNLDLKDIKVKEADNNQMYKLFQELEFKSLLKGLPAPALNIKLDVVDVSLDDLLKSISKEELFSYADGDYAYFLSTNEKTIYKIPFEKTKDIFAGDYKKISYAFKTQMINSGISFKSTWFDVKIAAYLLDSSLIDYELVTLVAKYLGEFVAEIPSEAVCYFVSKLYKILYGKIKEDQMDELLFNVEMPLMHILYDMHKWGINIDLKRFNSLSLEVNEKIDTIKEEIFKICGKEFNLNSPKQLSVVLFEDLKIPPIKKTKTGYSTGEEVLEKLSSRHEIAKLILEYRELNKLKTTYIVPLIESVQQTSGRLHAQFNQTVTQTGRLSSSSPNLQSIPAKGRFCAQLRSVFVPSFEGGYIICADYSQIELRILAHFSGDENLKEAFSKKLDIHRYTASMLFNIKENEVNENQRNLAKKINFAILYGMSAYGLAQEMNVNVNEAQTFIDDYFNRYPKVKDYIYQIYDFVEKTGFVKTILNRRRYLADFKSSNPQMRDFAMRQAVNSPIQGSCADLIKVAMVAIDEEFRKNKLESKLIMQIHDELVFDVPRNELDMVRQIAKHQMETSIKLDVPIEVNIKVGKNWGQVQ